MISLTQFGLMTVGPCNDMSAIKDIVDLCTQLRNERRETWVAPIIDRIQSLTQQFQLEFSEVQSKNSKLESELVDLKREIFQMEQRHAEAIADRDAAMSQLKAQIARRDSGDADGISTW